MPEFAQPLWLLLLLVLPGLMWLGMRSREQRLRRRRTAVSLLRGIALAALVVALAGPLKGSYSEQTDVVFVLDVSRSIDRETTARAIDLINRALAAKHPRARMGLVVFGEDTATELLLHDAAEPLSEISVEVVRSGTNIARALQVAMSTFQSNANRRVVLLSDGRENAGQARAAAAVARSIGVEISTIALEREAAPAEVLVRGVTAPPRVRVREPFNLEVTVESSTPGSTHLVLTRNGIPIGETVLELQAGTNRVTLVEQADEAGLYEYEAVVNSERDGVAENNRYRTFVQARGRPRVLHAVGDAGWGRYVTEALRTQGLSVDEIEGTALPTSLHALSDYDLVILDNVPGFDVSLAKMELLEDFVRDTGGGLISLGGDKSYSAGGYYGTPIERLLPVTMDIQTDATIPTLAVTIVIDRSGSMSSGGKLVIAKAAAVAALEVMNPLDRVAVLAFDDQPEWSVPPSEVGNRRAIIEQLRMVASGGGTDLYRALEEAYRVMLEQQARVKHIIVLSDGLTETVEDFKALIERMTEAGITVSTVAFGADADRRLMAAIAALGQGRHYFTDDPKNIPRIFTSETLVVGRDLLVEETTVPQLAYRGEILAGFPAGAFPALDGYQRIFAKPAARVLLKAGAEDPLLVTWRYGLGRAVAFTSDLAGRWGKRWVSWPEFPRFVAQMARWTMRRTGTEQLLPEFSWHGTRGEVVVDVLDRDDQFINGLDMRARLVDPNSQTHRLVLEQVAPGRYRGEFTVPESGRYYFNLRGTGAGQQVGPSTFGLAVPYSSEYLNLGVDHPLLADVAHTTAGKVLTLSNRSLSAIMRPASDAVTQQARVWWPLLAAALAVLIVEIIARKLTLPERWRLRLRAAQRSRESEPAEPGYEELVANIASMRAQHLAALKETGRNDLDDPAVRARLYLSSSGRR